MAISKNRSHKSRNIDDHLVDKSVIDKDVLDADKWEVSKGEVHSSTRLEDDQGVGKPVIVRTFTFKANPEAFREHTPSKQELFNAHAKQIEVFLWKDGLQVMPDVKPQVALSKKRDGYRIVVGAEAAKGHIMDFRNLENIKTLSQIANDSRANTD